MSSDPIISPPTSQPPRAAGNRTIPLAEAQGLPGQWAAGGPALAEGLAQVLSGVLGGRIQADRFSLHNQATALGRPMAVAHLEWPRLRTRLALGVDPPLAHALADRLLGFERDLAELHLQITPVEWGLLEFLARQGLDWLDGQAGPLGPWDLVIDRVGPGPFNGSSLGPVATLRWRVRVGNTTGSARLWVPWSLLARDRASATAAPAPGLEQATGPTPLPPCLTEVATDWQIVAGTATLPVGSDGVAVRVGKLVLIDNAPLGGEPARPTGAVTLAQDPRTSPRTPTWQGQLEPDPDGCSARLTIGATPTSDSGPTHSQAHAHEAPGALDPTALRVVLGSIRLTVGQLAALEPGTALDVPPTALGPVELRGLDGRCVARGELVPVDTELAIRITEVVSRPPTDPSRPR